MDRTTLGRANGMARSGSGRATIGEIDDDHLVQEIKSANGFYSETMTNEGSSLERIQPVGMTAVPLKQFEEEGGGQQGGGQQGGGGQGGQGQDQFNNNQPKGESAEAVMLYLNGSRSQRVAMVDDRRVRPFKMKAGDAALYHASGTEQKTYLSDQGAMLIANNNASVEKNAQEKDRFASLRHVNLKKQNRKIKKGEKPPDHKHEGDSVNCEVRCTKDRIEFRFGDEVVGYYDRGGKKWNFNGDTIEHVAKTVSAQVETRFETVGKTYLGLDEKEEKPPIGETDATRYKKTYVKLA